MNVNLDKIAEHVTDLLAIVAIVAVAMYANPTYEVLGAIVAIAGGKRYLKHKMGSKA
jgi:hypothetical protein